MPVDASYGTVAYKLVTQSLDTRFDGMSDEYEIPIVEGKSEKPGRERFFSLSCCCLPRNMISVSHNPDMGQKALKEVTAKTRATIAVKEEEGVLTRMASGLGSKVP